MLRHHDQVGDARPSAVIAHDHQAGIVPRREPRGHRGLGPVQPLATGPTFLGLEFVSLGADAAMEIRHRRVGREGGQGRGPATGAEAVGGDPAFGQDAGVLGRALEDGGVFGEAEIAPRDVVFGHAPAYLFGWRLLR